MLMATGMLPSGRVIDPATPIVHYAKGHDVKVVHMNALKQASLLRDEVANASDEKMIALPSVWKELVQALQRQYGETKRAVAEKAPAKVGDKRDSGFVDCVCTLAAEQTKAAEDVLSILSKLVAADTSFHVEKAILQLRDVAGGGPNGTAWIGTAALADLNDWDSLADCFAKTLKAVEPSTLKDAFGSAKEAIERLDIAKQLFGDDAVKADAAELKRHMKTYTVTKMAGVLMHKLTRGDISPEQIRAHVVAEVKAYNSTQPDEPWEEVLPSALVQKMRESITGKKKAK
jgi:hypothetical protein